MTEPSLAECGEGETLDALSGHFKIFQLRDGHRFSTDDILTAWFGTSTAPAARRVLDLGSGLGSVGMTAAWRMPAASFVTVEAQEESVRLARKSIRYNGLEGRYEIRLGDFRDPGILHPDERFDLVLGSPPYFPLESGVLGDHPQKIACRFEVRGDIAHYCEVSSRHLSAGGIFACIFPVNPPHQLERVWQGARKAGLTITRYRPVMLKEGDDPLLGLFAMMRSEHLPEAVRGEQFLEGYVETPLMIRTRNGQVHPEYRSIKHSIGFKP